MCSRFWTPCKQICIQSVDYTIYCHSNKLHHYTLHTFPICPCFCFRSMNKSGECRRNAEMEQSQCSLVFTQYYCPQTTEPTLRVRMCATTSDSWQSTFWVLFTFHIIIGCNYMLDNEDKLLPISDYLNSFPTASELQEDVAQPGGTNMTNTPSHQCAHVHAQVVWDTAAKKTDHPSSHWPRQCCIYSWLAQSCWVMFWWMSNGSGGLVVP